MKNYKSYDDVVNVSNYELNDALYKLDRVLSYGNKKKAKNTKKTKKEAKKC